MRIERNLKLINYFTLCYAALFIIPVFLPFYINQVGLGYRELLLGQAAFAAAMVLCDVPTGWISDVWQRKYTLALGACLNTVGWAYLFVAHSLWQILMLEAVVGVGFSLLSGTHTALLYDSLFSVGRESDYRKLEGKRQAWSFYAQATASVIGGFLYSFYPYLPLVLMALASFLAIFIALSIDEPERHKRIGQKHPVADIIDTMKYALHGHAEVGFIIFFAAVMFCSTKLIMWSQQPYYMALHFPSTAFGLLMAVGFLLGGVASHWAHLLDGKIKTFHALMVAWLVAVFVCIGAGVSMGYLGVAFLMIGGSCIFGTASPRVNEAINNLVGSDRRATILSTQSFMMSLFFIPISALMGWVAGAWGVQASLFAIALWLGIAGLCLAAWSRYRSSRQA